MIFFFWEHFVTGVTYLSLLKFNNNEIFISDRKKNVLYSNQMIWMILLACYLGMNFELFANTFESKVPNYFQINVIRIKQA